LILIACIIPGHLIFFFTIYTIQAVEERPELTISLVSFYLFYSFTQVNYQF